MPKKLPITTKTIPIELHFRGDGTIVEKRPNVFAGGVIEPELAGELHFNVRREVIEENGILNPVIGEDTLEAAFQINLWGTSQGFRELGRYLLAVAELDTGTDYSFHEHHEAISGDGRTHLHIIVRIPTDPDGASPQANWIAGS